jgi:Ser/Thr protein kinase RdoA (MazF antagonist)
VAVIDAFRFEGAPVGTEPLEGGHIHENFQVTCSGGRYVLQRLNDRVFPDLEAVVTNVERVVAHLRAKGRSGPKLVETRDGALSFHGADASTWRAFCYLEGTVGRRTLTGPDDAYEAARAFADYLVALTDFPAPPPAVTIERFHDLVHRRDGLEAVAAADPVGRRSGVREELDRARSLGDLVAERLRAAPGRPCMRIVHNDAKLSNVRFDITTGRAACVVDLDTTMPGHVAYDVGELVRTVTTHAPEDAAEETTVDFDLDLLDALASGYFAARPPVESSEVDAMSLAGPHMAVENAARFLADYLAGDRYFAVTRAEQNLDRCRTQLRLTELMLEAEVESRACFVRASRAARAAPEDRGPGPLDPARVEGTS